MTTPLPRSPLLDTLARFRRDVDRRDRAAIKQLSDAYRKLFQRLNERLELEARRIFESGGDAVSRQYIIRRLERLSEQVAEELQRYSAFLETAIDTNTDDALTMGSRHALELMRAATGNRAGVVGINWGSLNPAQVNTMIGFLAPSSPLYRRIGQLARFHAPIVRDQLVEAIALGYNPYKTAGNIAPFLRDVAAKFQVAMARPFADAVRMARTAQLYAYRESNRANYAANSDVISGWQWFANLDGIVCPACVSLHGSIHPIDEQLDGHPHCRCTPIPVVLGQPLVAEDAGRSWFESQSEAQQRSILGAGAFDAWKAGKFDFSQLNKHVPDDVYGSFAVVPPLKELVGEG